MIKVIEVSSDSNIGGAGKCIITFLKYFDRSRFDVSVVLPKNSLLKPEAEELGVTVYEMDNLAEKSLDFKAIGSLRKLFKELKPDIVHTHASMSARIAAKLCGIKTVYTRHSVFEPPAKISRGAGKLINGAVNNLTADRIIAVAEAAKDNLTATGVSANKIEVILNGVEPLSEYDTEKRIAAREKFGIAPDETAVALIARLTEVKGQRYLIDCAEILKNKGYKIRFLIAGTGDTESELKAYIAQKNLSDTVVMTGFLSDVEPLMNAMDIQANCSFGTEATSLSLLQGMSLGKPAVVTRFGGNPGVIKQDVNGALTPIKAPEAMAKEIERLINDKELYSKMSKGAKRTYKETFTAEVNTRNIERLYESLIV